MLNTGAGVGEMGVGAALGFGVGATVGTGSVGLGVGTGVGCSVGTEVGAFVLRAGSKQL